MGLKCGIIGITNSGKTTLFNCMSGAGVQTSVSSFSSTGSNLGMMKVPDRRLCEIARFQETRKIVPTTVDIVDIPGVSRGSLEGNRFLGDVRNTDALIHVLRCFDDPNVPHVSDKIDPLTDLETVGLELQVKDMEILEKKIEKLVKPAGTGDREAKKGLDVLYRYREHFENLQPARTMKISEKDKRHVEDLDFLSEKPVLYVCNVDDRSSAAGNEHSEKVKKKLKEEGAKVVVIAARIEAEISELESSEERKEFLDAMGLEEPGVDRLTRAAYSLLNLRTFFTIGPKEIRAWTIRAGMNAHQAAGVIHSDMERGFIRAEVIKFADFVNLRSEAACRNKGKISVEGKSYEVKDGDILNIRFNV